MTGHAIIPGLLFEWKGYRREMLESGYKKVAEPLLGSTRGMYTGSIPVYVVLILWWINV